MKCVVIIITTLALIARQIQAFPENISTSEIAELFEDSNVTTEIQPESSSNTLKDDTEPVKVSYSGSQLWKVEVDKVNKLHIISKLRDEEDLTTWGGNSTVFDILIRPTSINKVKRVLSENSIKYYVIIEDLQKAIDTENPVILDEDDLENRKGHRLTWQAYHRLNDIHDYLDYLAVTYPNLCTVQTIGSSVQGRALKLLKISNGNPSNNAMWIDGGIHAREWISPATVTYIIDKFVTNYDSEQGTIKNIDWYFLPVANPDGYEYSHQTDRLWRKNRARNGYCPGTDLNRNFGYHWGERGSSKNPCRETYCGTAPFSEPETAAIQKFITGNSQIKWKGYVSFHSYGQYILFPWGYDRVVPPDYSEMQSIANKAATAIRQAGGPSYTVGSSANTLYPASGGSDDWAKGSAHMKYAYTIELRDNGRYGFVLPASYIIPTAREALEAIRVIGQAAAITA